MRILIFIGSFLAVLAMAYWAYQQNFQTMQARERVQTLQVEIASAREAIAIQRAEWAYLNRPSRLRDLVDLNFDELQLLPMTPRHFGTIDEVPFPLPDLPATADIIDGLTDTENAVGPAITSAPDIDGVSFP